MEVNEWSASRSGHITPGERAPKHPLNGRLGGVQSLSGCFGEGTNVSHHSVLARPALRRNTIPTKGRFTLCVTLQFRHRSIFVLSEWSVFTLSVVFIHLPQQHKIGGLRLFPSYMQPTVTECILRYLLIIGTSVMIE